MSSRTFILCADDYALSTTSCAGILSLLQQERLSAVSCVVNTPLWLTHYQALLPFQTNIDIGLHFNLTEGIWLSQPTLLMNGLNKLIIHAYMRRLSKKKIKAELIAQLQAFSDNIGKAPDFIDGHQHIQQLPIIRDVIIEHLLSIPTDKRPYLRCSYLQQSRGADTNKRRIINALGAKPFKRLLEKHCIVHNTCFSGVYNFSPTADYACLFRDFLSELTESGMIMCHPALGLAPEDPHAQARQHEYDYFASAHFINDCHRLGFNLSRGNILTQAHGY